MKVMRAEDIEERFFDYKEMEEIAAVKGIIHDVKKQGDDAVKKYTLTFDGVNIEKLRIDTYEIADAYEITDSAIINAMKRATENIKLFAEKQLAQFTNFEMEIVPGVIAGQKVIPIERIGIYVPGGRFPLISTLFMCAIPAKVAGVKEIAVCSPPSHNGSIHPSILAAAKIAGIDEIYKIGGVQAIAAMAYGTQTIKKVDKIVGPGNKYVTLAKKEVFGIVGIDFIAAPTEIMIIADRTANPSFIAADLLAQAEHDIDAIPILMTDSLKLAENVKKELKKRLAELKTKEIAAQSLEKNGKIIIVENLDKAIEIANKKAPEHLELHVSKPNKYVQLLRNYGSLFIGRYSAGVFGDYSSGLNHVLPTNGAARYTGGLSVKDFIKILTYQEIDKKAVSEMIEISSQFAEIEGLDGHKKSALIRTVK